MFAESITSSMSFVLMTLFLYLGVVAGYNSFRSNKPTSNSLVQQLFIAHNVFLSIASLVLLVSILSEIYPIFSQYGFIFSICHSASYTPQLEYLYYINYLLKYYELIDTIFLIIKSKQLLFLHYFHHALTIFLCWSQMSGKTSVSWVVITLNLAVHVLMYLYYALSAVGIKVRWKMAVTVLQITQFVIDMMIVNLCFYIRLSIDHWETFQRVHSIELPRVSWGALGRGSKEFDYSADATCEGTYASGLFGWFVLSSYLVLFIDFFVERYRFRNDSLQAKTRKQVDLKEE